MPALNFESQLENFFIRAPQIPESDLIAVLLSQMEPWRSLDYSPATLRNYLLSPDPSLHCRMIITAPPDAELIGVFAVRAPWLFGAYLELFAIFPNYQDCGIGRKFLAFLEQAVLAAAGRNFWILVSAFNHPARNFYLRNGYHEVGKLDNLLKNGYDEILLRKQLVRIF